MAADGSCTVLLNRGWVPAEWRVRLRFAALFFATHLTRVGAQTAPPPASSNPCCVNVVGVVRAR